MANRNAEFIIENALSPYVEYCSGASLGSGRGYIAAPVIAAASVKMTCTHPGSQLLDEIIAFDRAETSYANIGQTNMIQVSSFNGLRGLVLGHDLLKQQKRPYPIDIGKGKMQVFDLETLCEVSRGLFGTLAEKRFPIAPGEHVPCAYKTIKARGPAIIYSALALAIARNRDTCADLFMEDLGTISSPGLSAELVVLENLYRSVEAIGNNLGVEYESIYMGLRKQVVSADEMGCALIAAPYIQLARNAVPSGYHPKQLLELSFEEWETLILRSTPKPQFSNQF